LHEAERPNAKEVTANLRFVIISEVVASIDRLFESMSSKEESLDVFLQLKRFEAWTHGIGIIDHNKTFTTGYSTMLDDKTFYLMLQSLENMRACLNSMSTQIAGALITAEIRKLAQLNDCLINALDEQQHDRARTCFSSIFLESKFSDSVD